jgi:hypothetical protein
VFDSPIDALLHLHVSARDAYDVVSASWRADTRGCFVCTIGGGRSVAAIRTHGNRWTACAVLPEGPYATRDEAKRFLKKRIKKDERGIVFKRQKTGRTEDREEISIQKIMIIPYGD